MHWLCWNPTRCPPALGCCCSGLGYLILHGACFPPGVTDIPPCRVTVGAAGWQLGQSHRGTRGFPPFLSGQLGTGRDPPSLGDLLDVTTQPE